MASRAMITKAIQKANKGEVVGDLEAGWWHLELVGHKLNEEKGYFQLKFQVLDEGDCEGVDFVQMFWLRAREINELVRVLKGFGISFDSFEDLQEGDFTGYKAYAQVSVDPGEGKDGKPTVFYTLNEVKPFEAATKAKSEKPKF